MKKKETIILLSDKQNYHITAYACDAIAIHSTKIKPTESIGILSSGKVTFKAW